jgi:hypothetical protein
MLSSRIVGASPAGDLYLNESWLSVRWDREHNCVHSEWKGFANSVEFRKGTMRTLEAIRDKNAGSLVSDTRRLEVVTNEDQLWMRDTWVPLAVAAGLKRIALVVANQGLGKFAVQEIVSHVGPTTFVTRTFESLSEALEWVHAEHRPH